MNKILCSDLLAFYTVKIHSNRLYQFQVFLHNLPLKYNLE